MTVSNSPDGVVYLNKLNDSIHSLRHTLKRCALRHAELLSASRSTLDDGELQTLSRQLLSHTILVKLLHDRLIFDVDTNRQNNRREQEKHLRARLRLQNLQYEKASLTRQIAQCRSVSSPSLESIGIQLPDGLFDADSNDDVLNAAQSEATSRLEEELGRRKRKCGEVSQVDLEIDKKRRLLSDLSKSLIQIPQAVEAIQTAVRPVQKIVDISGASALQSTQITVRDLAKLPAPLFVLVRQIAAFQKAFDAPIDIGVVEDIAHSSVIDHTKNSDCHAAKDGSDSVPDDMLYHAASHAVHITIKKPDVNELLQICFRYLDRLDLVTVQAKILSDGDECRDPDVKGLQLLFPGDTGVNSPKASHSYLQDGNFLFDVEKAGGYAFVWANVLCGIKCSPMLDGSTKTDISIDTQEGAWVREACNLLIHRRAAEVIRAIQDRLLSIVSLKAQLESLSSKRSQIKGTDIGFEKEPIAQIVEFSKTERDPREDKRLFQDSCGRITDVWSLVVMGADGVCVENLIELDAAYPQSRPVFRARLRSATETVREVHIVEMERLVNEAEVPNEMGKQLLLSVQVTQLLGLVDRIELARRVAEGKSVDHESSNTATRGRRTKRDSLGLGE